MIKGIRENRCFRAGLRPFFVMLPIVLTGGCMLGPDFQQPEAEVAAEWAESDMAGVSANREDLVEWWEVFGDPALNRLVKKASEENLSLQMAGLRVMEARAQLGIAVGNAWPQVQQATGGLSYNRNPAYAPKPEFTAASAASVGFDASWELDLWGKYRRGIESANANLLANVAGYEDVVVSLTAEVARTYVLIRSLEERVATAKANIVTQIQSTEITKALWDEGAKSELDYQQAATTLYSTQAPAIIAAGIPSDLLRRRADIRQAEYQAAAQCAQIGIAKTDLYPRISLLGSIGWSSSNIGSQGLDDLFNSTTFSGNIGPSATWNVLNYGRIENNVRVQDATFQEALTNYQQLVLSAAGEVEDAVVGFSRSRTQAVLLKKSVDASQRALDLALLQYKEGQSTFQRVLDSTRSLSSQQDQYIQAKGNITTSAVALYKALGGGWQEGGRSEYVPMKFRREMEERANWGSMLAPPVAPDRGAPAAAPAKEKIKGRPGMLL